jgi:hypothetical protein
MSIRRESLHFERGFTRIPNEWARDARLSWKARGLLAYLMSHTEGWTTSLSDLVEKGIDGRDAIRTGLLELERLGYLVRERARNDDGTLAGIDYLLQDPFSPVTDNPTQDDPAQDDPTPKKNRVQKTSSPVDEQQPRGRATNSQRAMMRDLYEATGRWITEDVEAGWKAMSIAEADGEIKRLTSERRRHP